MAPLCKLVRINNNFISLIIKALIIQVAPLCKLAGVSTRLVVTERAGHAQHMLQVSDPQHGGNYDGGGGDDVCWHAHAQHLLQVSASYGDDCGGDCCGDYYLIFRPSHWLNLME